MKGVTITVPLPWSTESWELVFLDKKASYPSHSYVFPECVYTNDDQIMIPILIPHRALERHEPCHAPVIARAAGYLILSAFFH